MTCDQHNVDFMGLLYGELEADEADAAHTRVEQCAGCAAEYSQLSATLRLVDQLPTLEPPRSLDDRIMAAAHAKVGATGPVPAVEAREGLWAMLLRWVGTFAMGPQVAMATVMMLVIGIGLWYFPRNPDATPEPEGSTMIDPPHQGEAAPSAALAPAEPLDLEIERRHLVPAGDAADEDKEEDERVAAAAPARSRRTARSAPNSLHGRDTRRAELAEAEGEMAAADEAALGAAPMDRAPGQAPASPVATSRTTVRSSDDAPMPAARTGAQGSTAAGSTREVFQRGLARERAGDHRGAAQDFYSVVQQPDPTGSALVPNALHRLADSYRRQGDCTGAIRQYESLLQRFPGYSQAGQAMLNLGRCYQQLGRVAEANEVLTRAERYNSVANEARIERQRANQVRPRRQAAPAAAEAYESAPSQ